MLTTSTGWVVFYNWTPTESTEKGFSLKMRSKQAENTPDWQHATNYHVSQAYLKEIKKNSQVSLKPCSCASCAQMIAVLIYTITK